MAYAFAISNQVGLRYFFFKEPLFCLGRPCVYSIQDHVEFDSDIKRPLFAPKQAKIASILQCDLIKVPIYLAE